MIRLRNCISWETAAGTNTTAENASGPRTSATAMVTAATATGNPYARSGSTLTPSSRRSRRIIINIQAADAVSSKLGSHRFV